MVKSMNICQGDIILLKDKDECPCDCVLLKSSNNAGVCYVSTSSLDGEMTLKPRYELIQSDNTNDVMS